jgi:ankyrin repeat protein
MDLAAFHESVKQGDLPAVTAALAVDPSLLTGKNAAGQSAFLLAKYYRQPAVANYLLSFEPELDIYESCAAGDLASVQRKLNLEPELLELHSPDGWTPLHLAAFFGERRVAEALLDRGAQVDARSTNRMQNTPLHAAAAGGNTSVVALLLERGADPNARQEGGWTALHAAAQSGNGEMVALLLRHGADREVRAGNNQLPLDLALSGGKSEAVALLEQATEKNGGRVQ